MKISILISSLPTQSASTRMRVWRSIKSSGAATLRDGVYILPFEFSNQFDEIVLEHTANEGTAHIFNAECPESIDLPILFNRDLEYEEFINQLKILNESLDIDKKNEHLKQIRKLRKNLNQLIQIDYFPTDAQVTTSKAFTNLEYKITRLGEADEPQMSTQELNTLNIANYQNKTWATRKRPWIDRLASAWLIQKFIDQSPTFMWLETPSDCPKGAIGFDFDGASFTHIESLVTFEVLIRSFNLQDSALNKIAEIVHYLDVGGHEPPEAVGFEKVIHGLKTTIIDDDQLLAFSNHIFDGLYADLLGEQDGK